MSADKGADSSTENDPHSRFMHACIAWGGGINGQQADTLQSAVAVLGSTQGTEQQAGQACLECLLNDVG